MDAEGDAKREEDDFELDPFLDAKGRMRADARTFAFNCRINA